jgi:hypothetical protein
MSEEIYVKRKWLIEYCGFEIMALKDMLKRYGFDAERTDEGYPLSQIIRALNETNKVRGQRRTFNLAQLEEMKKQEEIIKLQLYNGEKNGTLILRSYAKERVRIVFQNVVSKIRYAIKNISPRLVGVDSARVIEEVMIKGWNGAIELLEEQAKCIDWESDNPVTELSNTKPLTTYDTELDKIGTSMESLGKNMPVNDVIVNEDTFSEEIER